MQSRLHVLVRKFIGEKISLNSTVPEKKILYIFWIDCKQLRIVRNIKQNFSLLSLTLLVRFSKEVSNHTLIKPQYIKRLKCFFRLLPSKALLRSRGVCRGWKEYVDFRTDLWSGIPRRRYMRAARDGRLDICQVQLHTGPYSNCTKFFLNSSSEKHFLYTTTYPNLLGGHPLRFFLENSFFLLIHNWVFVSSMIVMKSS